MFRTVYRCAKNVFVATSNPVTLATACDGRHCTANQARGMISLSLLPATGICNSRKSILRIIFCSARSAMSESQSIPSRCLHLLRVHFVPISIVTVASFMLVPALFAIMRAVILSQPGASQLSPTALWESSSATVKTLAILIFLLATFLPQSLTEAGIAAIALSEAKNESIELRRLFGQLARSFPRILVLTLILGFVKVLGASTVVISVGVALSCALVMPVAGTTRLGPWISLKTGVKL